MNDDAPPPGNGHPDHPKPTHDRAIKPDRDHRLKTALKANLARRKAQTRARKAPSDPKD
jgi:hypothetical protein